MKRSTSRAYGSRNAGVQRRQSAANSQTKHTKSRAPGSRNARALGGKLKARTRGR